MFYADRMGSEEKAHCMLVTLIAEDSVVLAPVPCSQLGGECVSKARW